MPPPAASAILLAGLVLTGHASTGVRGIEHRAEAPAVGGQSVGRPAAGSPSRWVLFGGEFREDLDWLLASYADLARQFVHGVTPDGFPWGNPTCPSNETSVSSALWSTLKHLHRL